MDTLGEGVALRPGSTPLSRCSRDSSPQGEPLPTARQTSIHRTDLPIALVGADIIRPCGKTLRIRIRFRRIRNLVLPGGY